MDDQVNLLDVLHKLVRHRRYIMKVTLITTLLALGVSLIWPKTYKSTVQFFPPPREGSGLTGIFSSFLQPMVTSSKLSSEAVTVILRSRQLKEAVIDEFDLREVYQSEIMEELLEKVDASMEINEIREGGFGFNPLVSVEFSYLDEEPARAEAITAFYISKLDSVIKELNQERAVRTFETVEVRYNQNLQDMAKAEQALKQFQEKHGVFEIEAQTKALIEQLGIIRGEMINTELQLDIVGQTASRRSPQYQQLAVQKRAFEKKYQEMINKTPNTESDKVFKPISEVPELAIRYAQLFREVTVQNKVYEILYPNYEQARMQASMESNGIQVLDHAKLPTYKYKPKRAYMVIAGFMFGLFAAFVVVFLRELEASQAKTNPENVEKMRYIRESILGDLKFWKRSGK